VIIAPEGIVTSSVEVGTTPPTQDVGSPQLPPAAVAVIETGVVWFHANAL